MHPARDVEDARDRGLVVATPIRFGFDTPTRSIMSFTGMPSGVIGRMPARGLTWPGSGGCQSRK